MNYAKSQQLSLLLSLWRRQCHDIHFNRPDDDDEDVDEDDDAIGDESEYLMTRQV